METLQKEKEEETKIIIELRKEVDLRKNKLKDIEKPYQKLETMKNELSYKKANWEKG